MSRLPPAAGNGLSQIRTRLSAPSPCLGGRSCRRRPDAVELPATGMNGPGLTWLFCGFLDVTMRRSLFAGPASTSVVGSNTRGYRPLSSPVPWLRRGSWSGAARHSSSPARSVQVNRFSHL